MIPKFNLKSPVHMSLILFGGELEIESVEPVIQDGMPVFIKTGEKAGDIKVKKVKSTVRINGFNLQPIIPDWQTKKSGIYKANEEVLSLIAGVKDEL